MEVYRIACAILVTAFPLVQGRICYECNGLKSIDDCHNTTSCDSVFDKCFMDVYGQRGDLTYRLGCRAQAFCPSNASVDSSSDTDVGCHECCNSARCNRALCASVVARSAPSISDCDANCSDDPSFDCHQVDQVYGICHDIQNAKAVCRKFCGLCCPVDGAWSDWSSWGDCSATCGNGTLARRRTCDTPSPQNGGVDCQGLSLGLKQCSKQDCQISWSDWSSWSRCSETCGDGLTGRLRNCSDPQLAAGVPFCAGNAREYKLCNTNTDCSVTPIAAVDGQWGPWQAWPNICFTTGMGGSITRLRKCIFLTNAPHGKVCEGSATDQRRCDGSEVVCRISSLWAAWESWGRCAVTCGGGTRERVRMCGFPPYHPQPVHPACCEGSNYKIVDYREDCNMQPCT